MTMPNAIARAPVVAQNGFYMRNNLACNGAIPTPGPYDLCPDIIQSNAAIPNAQSVLSTQQSWAETYSTDPTLAQTNYYYVRGINGAAAATSAQVYLYYAPAQLILFPTAWKSNELPTAKGLDFVNVQADPGHIAVGDDAFMWRNTPVPPDTSTYYNFVAQVNDAANSNPIPTVTTWLDMSNLLTQTLGFGFRNTSYVDGTQGGWSRRLQLDVPQSITAEQQVVISISATGYSGATLGLLADTFGSNQQPMMILPFVVRQDGASTSITVPIGPGLSTSFLLQCWDTSTSRAAGSSVTLSVDYLIPNDEVAKAASMGLINTSRHRALQNRVGIGPQATAMLGAASFVVGSPPSA